MKPDLSSAGTAQIAKEQNSILGFALQLQIIRLRAMGPHKNTLTQKVYFYNPDVKWWTMVDWMAKVSTMGSHFF